MRVKTAATSILIALGLVVQPLTANAFTFGSYCIKFSSSESIWKAPKIGSDQIFSFTYINSCQKTIPSVQIDFSEDISGGAFSQWNTLSSIATLQNVIPGQQGTVQISINYDKYISARNKIYMRATETETTTSISGTTTTNNVTIQNIAFSTAEVPAAPIKNNASKASEKTSTSTAKKKTSSCTKAEIKSYEKARFQFLLSNTQIQRANDIKEIVEEARQAKSRLLGYFVDYSQKDLYTLRKQDATIDEYKIHRDEWAPTLAKLAKKCRLPMPSKSELLDSYYENDQS